MEVQIALFLMILEVKFSVDLIILNITVTVMVVEPLRGQCGENAADARLW